MTNDHIPPDVLGLLREFIRSEFSHVNRRLDEQALEMGKMRAENTGDHLALRRDFQGMHGDLNKALAGVEELQAWRDGHDKHHGKNDIEIAARIEAIADVKHDEAVGAAAVQKYKQRFAWVTDLGLDAVKAAALVAVGALGGAIGYLLRAIFG